MQRSFPAGLLLGACVLSGLSVMVTVWKRPQALTREFYVKKTICVFTLFRAYVYKHRKCMIETFLLW